MGNALGFVRMVRQAGLRYCTTALGIADGQCSLGSSEGTQQAPAHVHEPSVMSPGSFAGRGETDGSVSGETGDGAGDEGHFEELAKQDGLRGGAVEAAHVLDSVLGEFQAHASEGEAVRC